MKKADVSPALIDAIRDGNRFLLTSHIHPDGDAIGSEIGMARILRQLGKSTAIWNRDTTPRLYRALPGSEAIHTGDEPPAGFPDAFDAVLVMECPSPERTGLAEYLQGATLINIDHHLGNQQYGAVNWVDTAAPAVGEMAYRLARELRLEIDQSTANCLYLTLVTDTGGFRFSNTSARTFDAAAALVRDGASPEKVSQWLFESQPEGALRLLGEMLATLERHHDGRLATAWLERAMFTRAGAEAGDSEGLIDHPRSIAGVDAVALFREQIGGGFKVSLRSRGAVDIERVARSFGGGGHKNAAGFSRDGTDRQTLFRETLAAMGKALGVNDGH